MEVPGSSQKYEKRHGTADGERAGKTMIREWMTGILYPPKCPFCQRITLGGTPTICTSCEEKVKKISEPRCKKCGRPIPSKEEEFCRDCQKRNHLYEEGMAVYVYEGEVRKAVHRMKFQNRRVYGDIFGGVMAEQARDKIIAWGVEGIVPVPMYRKKQKKRGYNQAELLAHKVAEELNLKLYDDLVVRVRDTRPQKELSGKDRENNLKKAFIIPQNDVELKKILVVDDVYTTGSTINAVADVLRRCGAEKIYFLSLCIGRGEETEAQ